MTAFQPFLLLSVSVLSSPTTSGRVSGLGSGITGGGGIDDVNRVAGGGCAGCGVTGAGTADELVVDVGGIAPLDFAVDPFGTGNIIFGLLGYLFGIATSPFASGAFGCPIDILWMPEAIASTLLAFA